jgi:hypothetical protein
MFVVPAAVYFAVPRLLIVHSKFRKSSGAAR